MTRQLKWIFAGFALLAATTAFANGDRGGRGGTGHGDGKSTMSAGSDFGSGRGGNGRVAEGRQGGEKSDRGSKSLGGDGTGPKRQ